MTINKNGKIIWEGPSNYDGKPIVVIVTGFEETSANSKTGKMLQSWIIRQDVPPHHAFKDGEGKSVCGDCGHAGYNDGTCYVKVYQAPLSVWNCYNRNGYEKLGENWSVFDNTIFRAGSFGDPAMAPADIWIETTTRAKEHTGYTHQWRREYAKPLRGILQASCDGFQDYLDASSMGWKTYLVLPENTQKPANNIVHCAASEEKGKKTNCSLCHLCDGNTTDVMIYAHGSMATKVKVRN